MLLLISILKYIYSDENVNVNKKFIFDKGVVDFLTCMFFFV